MTKEEVKTNLTPLMHKFKDVREWRDAFNLYNAEHGTSLKTTSGCGKCYQTVREWLKR